MMDRKRAIRRGQAARMKSRARRVMRLWAGRWARPEDPRDLGVNVSTHCRRCACWMCQGPGKEVPPRRERAFAEWEIAEAGE